jgi:hypothetical protein
MNWDETPRTGWDHELMQDENSGLSKWLSAQPGARAHVRDVAALIEHERKQRESACTWPDVSYNEQQGAKQ